MTKTIGVTGGIGSGKSTVCKFLQSFGARIFNADDLAKRIMNDDLQVRQEVIDAFGVDSYTVSGRLNTGYLAKEIFSDTEHVKRINAIVHPRVLAAFSSAAEMARRDGVGLMVMEAALIYESGADELLDYVVVVDAPADARLARVSERDGVSKEEVAARMRHQLDPEELARRADFVIRNDGSLEDLRNKVAVVVRKVIFS
ncbi:MAG TPA: dephospho-CoA kinase [Rhodothermales bacterium]|nr:dephospho-CoA kinase [Rhodothermales bacterium]